MAKSVILVTFKGVSIGRPIRASAESHAGCLTISPNPDQEPGILLFLFFFFSFFPLYLPSSKTRSGLRMIGGGNHGKRYGWQLTGTEGRNQPRREGRTKGRLKVEPSSGNQSN